MGLERDGAAESWGSPLRRQILRAPTRGEGEEGDQQEEAQKQCESLDLWNRKLGRGTLQEAGPDLGTRGWGRVQ